MAGLHFGDYPLLFHDPHVILGYLYTLCTDTYILLSDFLLKFPFLSAALVAGQSSED